MEKVLSVKLVPLTFHCSLMGPTSTTILLIVYFVQHEFPIAGDTFRDLIGIFFINFCPVLILGISIVKPDSY